MANLDNFGLDEEELTKKAEKFVENIMWFENNKDDIKKNYANLHIAISNKKIIDSDKDLILLKKRIAEEGYDLSFVLFKFISAEDIIVIL